MYCHMVRVRTDSPKHVPNLAGMHGPRMFGSMFGASCPGALREGNLRGLKRRERKFARDNVIASVMVYYTTIIKNLTRIRGGLLALIWLCCWPAPCGLGLMSCFSALAGV